METVEIAGEGEVCTPNVVNTLICADENAEFVTGQDIAQMFKVSNSTVNLWKRQGMPFFGKSSCARFNKSEVIAWQRGQSQLPITKGKRVKKDAE